MATSLWQLLGDYEVEIPILQRDYAQGRKTGKVPLIRQRFLGALYKSLVAKDLSLELDFVYGNTKEHNGIRRFIPLDGQQRLTTLFLLHWFVALKGGVHEIAKSRLSKFTYQTRHSSKVFCQQLVKFHPDKLEGALSEIIINQPWFFTAWSNDPTVSSMLVMLDDIQNKFQDCPDVWEMLTSENPAICFHLLPMDRLGLPEDLYIKMNSRGKELTDFEHFKSQFSEILCEEDAWYFKHKVDEDWSDLFWDIYKDQPSDDIAKLVDDAFLRFYEYITDVIIQKNEIKLIDSDDDFEIGKQVYSVGENVTLLFACLDLFVNLYKTSPEFFDSVFYIDEEDSNSSKVRLFFQKAETDLFRKCAKGYKSGQFSIGEQLMLFGCIEHLLDNTVDFNSRIRILRNLIANSADEVRKDNLPSLLSTVTTLIKKGTIIADTEFNKLQIADEEIKRLFLQTNPAHTSSVFRLEDHELLQGCLAIVPLDTEIENYAPKFIEVFHGEWDNEAISRALLTIGDYSQKEGVNNKFGNQDNVIWRQLFTPSRNRQGLANTKDILNQLITMLINDSNMTFDSIIMEYLKSTGNQPNAVRDWRYYFIKYREFEYCNDGFGGFYHWPDKSKQYECAMMRKSNYRGYNWSPYLKTLKGEKVNGKIKLDNFEAPLDVQISGIVIKIWNLNDGYELEAVDEEGEAFIQKLMAKFYPEMISLIKVKQNDEGIDVEDRIEVGKQLIANIDLMSIVEQNPL